MKLLKKYQNEILREVTVKDDSLKPVCLSVEVSLFVRDINRAILVDVKLYPDKHFIEGVRATRPYPSHPSLTWDQEFLDTQINLALDEFRSSFCTQCKE